MFYGNVVFIDQNLNPNENKIWFSLVEDGKFFVLCLDFLFFLLNVRIAVGRLWTLFSNRVTHVDPPPPPELLSFIIEHEVFLKFHF